MNSHANPSAILLLMNTKYARLRPRGPRRLSLMDLLIYMGVQGYLAVTGLWHWNLAPKWTTPSRIS